MHMNTERISIGTVWLVWCYVITTARPNNSLQPINIVQPTGIEKKIDKLFSSRLRSGYVFFHKHLVHNITCKSNCWLVHRAFGLIVIVGILSNEYLFAPSRPLWICSWFSVRDRCCCWDPRRPLLLLNCVTMDTMISGVLLLGNSVWLLSLVLWRDKDGRLLAGVFVRMDVFLPLFRPTSGVTWLISGVVCLSTSVWLLSTWSTFLFSFCLSSYLRRIFSMLREFFSLRLAVFSYKSA